MSLKINTLKNKTRNTSRKIDLRSYKFAGFILLCLPMAGCSATSIRCGSDGESSYVDLTNIPDNLPNQIKSYAQLCNFSQEKT